MNGIIIINNLNKFDRKRTSFAGELNLPVKTKISDSITSGILRQTQNHSPVTK